MYFVSEVSVDDQAKKFMTSDLVNFSGILPAFLNRSPYASVDAFP